MEFIILKQEEKLSHDISQVRYYDVVALSITCKSWGFLAYMFTRGYSERTKIKYVCNVLESREKGYV